MLSLIVNNGSRRIQKQKHRVSCLPKINQVIGIVTLPIYKLDVMLDIKCGLKCFKNSYSEPFIVVERVKTEKKIVRLYYLKFPIKKKERTD